MKEMDEFKNALNELRVTEENYKEAVGNATTRHLKCRQEFVAGLFLDLGESAFYSLVAGIVGFSHVGYKEQIAAVKAERERESLEGKAGLGDTKLGYTIPRPTQESDFFVGQQLSREEVLEVPIGTVVFRGGRFPLERVENGFAPLDSNPEGEFPDDLYTIISLPDSMPIMPQPGDRLTAEQMKDAPDGTVVESGGYPHYRWVKKSGAWCGVDGNSASNLSGAFRLVKW